MIFFDYLLPSPPMARVSLKRHFLYLSMHRYMALRNAGCSLVANSITN